MVSKYNIYLKNFIKKDMIYDVNFLKNKLKDNFKITDENARKIISRAVEKKIIKTTDLFKFNNNQFAYISIKSALTYDMIKKASSNNPPLYRLMNVIENNEGIISEHEAFKITGSGIDRKAKKKNLDEILFPFLRKNWLIKKKYKEDTFIVKFDQKDKFDTLAEKQTIKSAIDALFIPDILKYLQRINIVDNKKVTYKNSKRPNTAIKHAGFLWDAICYSSTTGLSNKKNSKKSLVVLDFLIHEEYSNNNFHGFKARVDSIVYGQNRKDRVIPIIVTYNVAYNIVAQAKKFGYLLFDLSTIYGSHLPEIVALLLKIKENAIDELSLEELLKKIDESGQNNNLNNIKGDLFEAILHPLLIRIFSNKEISPSKNINYKGKSYEYDYIISGENAVTIVEAKAHKRPITLGNSETKNTFKWFYCTTFQHAIKYYREKKGCDQIFMSYISVSGLHEDALKKWTENIKGNAHEGSNLSSYIDKQQLITLFNNNNLHHYGKLINQYW